MYEKTGIVDSWCGFLKIYIILPFKILLVDQVNYNVTLMLTLSRRGEFKLNKINTIDLLI